MHLDDIPTGRQGSARIYALIAREGRRAVIIRRGPSKTARLLTWNLKSDRIVPGQWLKKRVYERRSDLSPDGRKLIYFAADWRAPYGTFTAISTPPYFSALALWPKGDAWGGGGHFRDADTVLLNHRPERYQGCEEFTLADGFQLPPRIKIEPLGTGSGWGEDDPVRFWRMQRDGWQLVQEGSHARWQGFGGRFAFERRRPEIVEIPLRDRRGRIAYAVRMTLPAYGDRHGRWNVELASIVCPRWHGRPDILRDLGRVDWVDLDHNGDVLWAWDGLIWRLKLNSADPASDIDRAPKLVADLNGMAFEAMETPAKAMRW